MKRKFLVAKLLYNSLCLLVAKLPYNSLCLSIRQPVRALESQSVTLLGNDKPRLVFINTAEIFNEVSNDLCEFVHASQDKSIVIAFRALSLFFFSF